MRVGYFDCTLGASGDMLLGAIIGAGVDAATLAGEIAKVLGDRVRLDVREVRRAGLKAIKADVSCRETDPHHRHLNDVLALIHQSPLVPAVKAGAERVFRRLAEAEACVHGCAPEQIHFHEVGALDAMADVIGAVAGIHLLQLERLFTSPLGLGHGHVECAHGRLPVPAPATLELVRGFPVCATEVEGELLTPTGAAIITTLVDAPGAPPPFVCQQVGVGAGTRDPQGWPNILRLCVGETMVAATDTVWVLETNIDDTPAEQVGYVFERLFAAGALDVFATPVQMKKGRPGLLLSVIADEERRGALERILFVETTTFGVRRYRAERTKLTREVRTVETSLGPVRVKLGMLDGHVCTAAPEYEDCRRLAAAASLPLREVYRQALRAYECGKFLP